LGAATGVTTLPFTVTSALGLSLPIGAAALAAGAAALGAAGLADCPFHEEGITRRGEMLGFACVDVSVLGGRTLKMLPSMTAWPRLRVGAGAKKPVGQGRDRRVSVGGLEASSQARRGVDIRLTVGQAQSQHGGEEEGGEAHGCRRGERGSAAREVHSQGHGRVRDVSLMPRRVPSPPLPPPTPGLQHELGGPTKPSSSIREARSVGCGLA
jgi:hypothetical protein